MWLHWDRTLGSLHLVSLDLPHAVFPFADSAWHTFAAVNHCHEYSYELRPMSHDSHSSSSDAIISPFLIKVSLLHSHHSLWLIYTVVNFEVLCFP